MCKEIEEIERRFIEVSGLTCDLSIFPMPENTNSQTQTDNHKSDLFGEVFTPIWLVDKMILRAKDSLLKAKAPLDLCAGYGQFTIRMLRCIVEHRKLQKKSYNIKQWLNNHSMVEYQLENAYRILYIFGTDVNLYIGDACFLNKIQEQEDDNGIFIFDAGKWLNITKKIKKWVGTPSTYDYGNEREFSRRVTIFLNNQKSVQTLLFQ